MSRSAADETPDKDPSRGSGARGTTGPGSEPVAGSGAGSAAGSAAGSGSGQGRAAADAPKPSSGVGEKQASPGVVIDMSRNPVGTAAVIAAVLLVVLGVIANLMLFSGVDDVDSLRRFTTVRDLLGIILGTGTVVLGIIGLTSRRTPRWGALVGLGIGAYVFLSSLASFIGSLMFA